MKKLILASTFIFATSFEEAMIYFHQKNPTIQTLRYKKNNLMGDVVVAKVLPSILDAHGALSIVRTDTVTEKNEKKKASVDLNVSLNLSQALIQGSELFVSNKGYKSYAYSSSNLELLSHMNSATMKAVSVYIKTLEAQEHYQSLLESKRLLDERYNINSQAFKNLNKHTRLKIEMDRQYITVKLQRTLNQKLQYEAQFKQVFYINPDNLQWPSEYSALYKTQALENRTKFAKQILSRNPDLKKHHIALTNAVIKSRFKTFNIVDLKLHLPTNLDSPDDFFSKGLHLSASVNLRTLLDTMSTMNSSYHEAFFNYKHQVVTLKYLVENAYNKIDNAREQLKTYAEFKQVLDEYMKTLDIQKSALDISHDRYLDLVKNIHEYEEQIISNKSALFEAYFDLILMANMLLPSKVSPILKA